MRELEIMTPLHKKTTRQYLPRMVDDKVTCMLKAKEYGFDYWDGDRRYGYGGYKYDGRWKPVAEKLIKIYNLQPDAKILDVGCGKGFLMRELKLLLPQALIQGIDSSVYALNHVEPLDCEGEEVLHYWQEDAQTVYPWEDKFFDLVISLMTLHNLNLPDLEVAITEIQRVGKNAYIYHESYRNEQEQFNLQCWALTAETIIDKEAWLWLYKHLGYTGDYEFAYFE